MKDLYKLKESLISELADYGKSGGLTSSSLDTIDKLAHATKNVAKVIECCEDEEYSNATGHSYRRDVTRDYVRPDGSYRHEDMSYARGRGAGAKRDSMGRYSRESDGLDEHTKEKLREMIESL